MTFQYQLHSPNWQSIKASEYHIPPVTPGQHNCMTCHQFALYLIGFHGHLRCIGRMIALHGSLPFMPALYESCIPNAVMISMLTISGEAPGKPRDNQLAEIVQSASGCCKASCHTHTSCHVSTLPCCLSLLQIPPSPPPSCTHAHHELAEKLPSAHEAKSQQLRDVAHLLMSLLYLASQMTVGRCEGHLHLLATCHAEGSSAAVVHAVTETCLPASRVAALPVLALLLLP